MQQNFNHTGLTVKKPIPKAIQPKTPRAAGIDLLALLNTFSPW
jgi:hypothetical protein